MTAAPHAAAEVDPPVYLPFEDGPFRMAMGLMALDLEDWIEIDGRHEAETALRRRLFEERRGEVLAVLPEAEDACREVLDLLADHLAGRFPERFRREGSGLTSLATGERTDLDEPAHHPLEAAARLVQEDLCILTEGDGGLRLSAAALCFPNRWRLGDKIGRPTAAIHEPVALYADRLARPVDRFLAILKEDKPVWRLNWGLTDHPDLFQPVAPPPVALTPETVPDRVFLRVERQTLRRLPRTRAVLFTIRTYRHPVSALMDRPAVAARLAAAVRALPEEVARYKGIARFRTPLLAALDRMAEAQGTAAAADR